MKKTAQLSLMFLIAFLVTSCNSGKFTTQELESGNSPKGIIKLTGTLNRPQNALPQIYLGEYGNIRRIDLKGKAVKHINSGTRIKIFGYMRTKYYDGGTDADQLAMPAQWKLWIDVIKVKVIPEN